jgi:hypothetical protein
MQSFLGLWWSCIYQVAYDGGTFKLEYTFTQLWSLEENEKQKIGFDEVQFYQVFGSYGSIGILLCEWNIPCALDIIFPTLKLFSFETKFSWDFKKKKMAQ